MSSADIGRGARRHMMPCIRALSQTRIKLPYMDERVKYTTSRWRELWDTRNTLYDDFIDVSRRPQDLLKKKKRYLILNIFT